MRKVILFAALISAVIVTISCDPTKKYEEEERNLIDSYVAENNITVQPDADGLYYIEITEGTGEAVETGDSLGVYYTGKFLSGREFDSNVEEDTPFRFRLGSYGLIEGWNIGLTYMKGGGKAMFLIPSKLAYGSTGFGYYDYYGRYISVIPGYTPLLFEVEVVELVKAK